MANVKLIIIIVLGLLAIGIYWSLTIITQPQEIAVTSYINVPRYTEELGIWNRTTCVDDDYWYNNGEGISYGEVDNDKLEDTINCLKKEINTKD